MAKKVEHVSHFDRIRTRIDTACTTLGVPDWMCDKLKDFKLVWSSGLEVKMDDGALKHFNACRVWHRSPHTDQPHKGGIRFHPFVNVDMMQAHAIEMSIKCWLMGIAMGGAKGGIAVDPALLSKEELKRLTEAYVDELDERNILGPFRDVPAPDVGTNPEIMNWIRQRYAQRRRSREDARFAGVVTGKLVGYGFDGIIGRNEATGNGVITVLGHVMERTLGFVSQPRVAIMGFGNVGMHAAKLAYEFGYKVVAVSDVRGGVYHPAGLNVPKLCAYVDVAKTVVGFPDADAITNAELLELRDIDALIPAALEHVLTEKNASKVSARFIIEGANSPTTPEADAIFEDRGVIVVPDVCANAGGVTVSFFEWARNVNIRDERVPAGNRDEVLASMQNILIGGVEEMCRNAEKYKTSLRNAAFVTAIGHVAPLFIAKHVA